MKYIFDLKGSILNRYTYITHLTPNKAPVLKDINFIKMNRTKKVQIFIYINNKLL